MSPKSKQKLLLYLNPVLFLLAVFQICSGVLMSQFFQLYSLHQLNGYLLGLAILLHIILNWSWIRMNYLPKRK
ncbi:MAG: DUF4405 domain-containing protein [Desulfohalobiaceae bacterium]